RLTRRHLLRAMAHAARSPWGSGFDHAGKAQGTTGLAFAAVHADGSHLTVGATTCSGSDPTPGRGWGSLTPWQRKHPERNVDKARAWAADVGQLDRVVVELSPLPATVERPAPEPDDPLTPLLAQPSAANLNRLVSQVNKAKGPALQTLIERLDASLSGWPDTERAGTQAWLRSLAVDHRKGVWRPGWRWFNGLQYLGKPAPE